MVGSAVQTFGTVIPKHKETDVVRMECCEAREFAVETEWLPSGFLGRNDAY